MKKKPTWGPAPKGIASWSVGTWIALGVGGLLVWLAVVIGIWSAIVWGVATVLGIDL